jgi:hypothetical protein
MVRGDTVGRHRAGASWQASAAELGIASFANGWPALSIRADERAATT